MTFEELRREKPQNRMVTGSRFLQGEKAILTG